MSVLRSHFVAGFFPAVLLMAAAGHIDAADDLQNIRSLAQAGATELALQRMEALQPAAPSPEGASSGAPSKGTSFGAPWGEWEHLRLQLLMRANRHEALLQRVRTLPPNLSSDLRAELHVLAAQAALVLGRGAVARDYAGRVLWAPGASAARVRELRLLVIHSFVLEASADEAYGSMLRYQQDYRPLDTATATGFVHGLLDLGMVKEAVNWLALLEERGAAKLRLRLHTELVTPQDAATLARAALSRGGDPRSEYLFWWRILFEAADRQKSGLLRIEALERLLNERGQSQMQLQTQTQMRAISAAALWEAYFALVRDSVNSHHLLAGDDAGWLDFALRRRDAEPVLARAYFAYLSRHARLPQVQASAQTQLASGFATGKLPRTGLRVFADMPSGQEPNGQTRRTLGELAEATGEPELVFRYWQGLAAPEGMSTEIWRLRLSAWALRAGNVSAATDLARQLADDKSTIDRMQVAEWLETARQFADHGVHDGARALYERVLSHATAAQQRGALSGIARAHEALAQPLPAADFYLRSASLAAEPDAAAVEARFRAGVMLARAGLRGDARTQFEWLLRNARDPDRIAAARRELGF